MASNQVTLTFAGDSSNLEKAFDRVGASAKGMSDDVGSAAKGFDKLDDASGHLEKAGRGLRDAFTGTQDTMKGVGALMKGDFSAETFMLVGAGVADLGGAFADLIIPMARSVGLFIAHKTAMIAHAVASATVTAATKTWAAIQWILNAALTANPIGIVIVLIGLLVGAIIWIATKTTWFQTAWKFAWGGIKSVAMGVWNWLKDLPGRIGSVFVKVAEFIGRPFRSAFNAVANAWNSTIGRLRFTFPDWVPGLGGKTIAVPTLPTFKFHAGGRVPGAPGQEVMAVLQAGERVLPAGSNGASSAGSDVRLSLTSGDDRAIITLLDGVMRRNGLRLVRA
jgi:hypothetical protein